MKRSGAGFPGRFMVLGAMVAGVVSVSLPPSEALGVGSWAYPDTADERVERIKKLDEQLDEKNRVYEERHAAHSDASEALAQLESRIRVAEENLAIRRTPVREATEKYRMAQEISLVDPQISTEPQRLALVQAREEYAGVIQEFQAAVDKLREGLPPARERVSSSRVKLNDVLKQIDDLVKHRESVSDVVFVRSVAD